MVEVGLSRRWNVELGLNERKMSAVGEWRLDGWLQVLGLGR